MMMNIFQKTGYALVALVILSTPHQAQAGFEATFGGSSESAKGNIVSTNTVKVEQDYSLAKGIDDQAPALKVFNEHYVPDSIRQKYNLSEGNSIKDNKDFSDVSPASGIDMPQPLTPEIVSASQNLQQAISMSPTNNKKPQIVASWRARKGENIRDVLRRWSERESVDLMWASPDSPTLLSDFSHIGKFQDAVGLLLKQTGVSELHSQFRSEGMAPVMMNPASTVTTNLPIPQESSASETETKKSVTNSLSSIFKPQAEKSSAPETRWFGLSGAPLAEVLQV